MSEDDFYYSKLQELVLSASGIKSICMGDCRGISIKIFEKDKNYLSEKTIICFFGLKDNQKMPSAFVLDSLSRFTGQSDWEGFKNAIAKKHLKQPDET